MKIKVFAALAMVTILSLTLMTTASAALPANRSWVKYASNPVLTAGTCTVGSPVDPSVLVDGGTYKMYFSNHPIGGSTQIFQAISADAGLTWTCGNGGVAVLTVGGGGAWDETRVGSPVVIKDGADYKMWYGGRSSAGVQAIGYATSLNGTSWTKVGAVLSPGSPSAWDSQYIREPAVVKNGANYHMWYSGTAKWPYFKIGHATSTDGIVWTKDTANPVLGLTVGSFDGQEVYAPSVVLDDGVYEMFYSGNGGGRWVLGHASSSNGTVWTKDNNAIITPSASGWDSGDSTDYAAAVLDGGVWKLFYSGAGGPYQIGLATFAASAQLTFNKSVSTLAVDATTTINIDLSAVTSMAGYQFKVLYPSAVISPTVASFNNSFFDTSIGGAFVAWNADCATLGECKFSVSKLSTGAVTGFGTLAQITFKGIAPGEAKLTFSDNILTQFGAVVIPHTSTVGYMTVFGSATVTGVVALQGRTTPKDAGTVTVYGEFGYSPAVTVPFDASTGAFTAVVPFNSNDPTFEAVASHSLYLSNKKTGIALTNGGTFAQGTTTLLGGDADNSGKIDISDLACMGGAFGGSPTVCGVTGSTDINKDLIVNILDLVLAGGNYDLSSPHEPW